MFIVCIIYEIILRRLFIKCVDEGDVQILSKQNRLILQSVSHSVSQSLSQSASLLYNFSNCCLYSSLRIYSFPDCAIFHGKNSVYCCLQMYVQSLSLVSEVIADCWIMSAASKRNEVSENLCDKSIFLTKQVLSKRSNKFRYIISFTTGTVTLKYLQHYRQKFKLPCVVKPSVLGCVLYC